MTRSQGTLIVLAAVATLVVMLILQRGVLLLPVLAAVPAAGAAGVLVEWRRGWRGTTSARFVVGCGAAALVVVADALLMAGPSLRYLTGPIVLGWLVTAIVLTLVHVGCATLAGRLLGAPGSATT